MPYYLSARRFVIGDHIPKVDYRTLLDTYLDFCFYLQLFTMFATVLVHWVYSSEAMGGPLIAERLNWAFFAVELVVAYIFHEWIYFKVCNNELDIEHWVHRSKVTEMEEYNSKTKLSPSPNLGTHQSPRPSPRGDTRGKGAGSLAPLDSPTSANETYELEREMLQLARRKHKSTLVRVLQSLAVEPDQHNLDDGSLMKSIFASEHFIHFGAVQISKKVLTDIKAGLESTLKTAQMKTHHVRLLSHSIYYHYFFEQSFNSFNIFTHSLVYDHSKKRWCRRSCLPARGLTSRARCRKRTRATRSECGARC